MYNSWLFHSNNYLLKNNIYAYEYQISVLRNDLIQIYFSWASYLNSKNSGFFNKEKSLHVNVKTNNNLFK